MAPCRQTRRCFWASIVSGRYGALVPEKNGCLSIAASLSRERSAGNCNVPFIRETYSHPRGVFRCLEEPSLLREDVNEETFGVRYLRIVCVAFAR